MQKIRVAIKNWKKQKTRIIALAGPKKSGKDVFLNYIERHFGPIGHLRIADAPAKIAQVLELPPERKILQALFGVNAILRPVLGESAYVRRVGKILDRTRPRLAIVEAIRTKEEYEEFVVRRKGILVGIAASPDISYGRAVKDGKVRREKRDEATQTFKEFMDREKLPIEKEIAGIVNHAHFVLPNSHKQKNAFYQAIDAVMKDLGIKRKR